MDWGFCFASPRRRLGRRAGISHSHLPRRHALQSQAGAQGRWAVHQSARKSRDVANTFLLRSHTCTVADGDTLTHTCWRCCLSVRPSSRFFPLRRAAHVNPRDDGTGRRRTKQGRFPSDGGLGGKRPRFIVVALAALGQTWTGSRVGTFYGVCTALHCARRRSMQGSRQRLSPSGLPTLVA